MLRIQRVQRRRAQPARWLRWLLLFGIATYAVIWIKHLLLWSGGSRPAAPPPPESCAARLAALGLAFAGDKTGHSVRLVPAAATAHVTASTVARRILYDSMSEQLRKAPLLGAVTTQGLQQSSLFSFEGDTVTPVLHRLAVPVRAIIAPFSDATMAARLAVALKRHLAPVMAPGGLWRQDPALFHSTLWHASHHQTPVPAGRAEVDAEAAAVRGVAIAACPMRVALERVVATASGTVLACWQLVEGTEPEALRAQLAAALPNAPVATKQAVRQPEILHTTLARILKPPVAGGGEAGFAAVQRAAAALTAELCGVQSWLRHIWYVEELDLLALALGGSFRHREAPLECHTAAA